MRGPRMPTTLEQAKADLIDRAIQTLRQGSGGLQLRQAATALAKRLDGAVDQIGFGLLQRRRHPWSSHLRRLDCPGSNRGVPPSENTAPPPTVVSGRRRVRIGRRYAWAQAKRGQAP